jgi:hypothetical protein
MDPDEFTEDDWYDPDQAYEEFLENAGWQDTMAQDDYEMRMGVIPFHEAMEDARHEQVY